MGLLSNLLNTTQNTAGVGANLNQNAAPSAPSALLVDLGIPLGNGLSALNPVAQVLGQSAGNSPLGSGTSTTSAALDLNGALAALTQALNQPSLGTPALSSLSDLVNNVLETVGVEANVDLDVGLGTPGAPLIDLGVSLGSGDLALNLGAEVLDQSAGGSLLGVDLNLGTAADTAASGIHPSAGMEAGTGATTAPVGSAAGLPGLTDLLDNVIDAVGLGSLPGIDLGIEVGTGGSATPIVDIGASIGGGSTPAPSTGVPTTPSTGGTPIPTNPGGTPTTPTTGVPTTPGTGTTDGTPSAGGTTTPTVPGGATDTDGTGGSGHGNWSSVTVDMDNRGFVEGGSGNDTVMGLGGNDTVYGHAGNDTVLGNQGNDQVFGGAGDDLCHGGRDDDYVSGGAGDDRIWGDFGDDTLEGGDGADTFLFTLNSGNDIILDFNHAQGDRLDFQGQTFAVADVGGTAIITLSGGGAVVLSGVSGAEFNSYGFA